MIMVSRVSPDAVAAVALTNQPVVFALALFVTLNVGATVIVSRAIGGGYSDEANRGGQVSFNLNLLIMLPMTIVFTVVSETILRFRSSLFAVRFRRGKWKTIKV
ncbi:hypothetical protein IDH45_22445 [Paenibacillus sp. IB182363]|uniref:Uncharacterized protein n=2 Tax=Paenibacillus oceani TaxID=2772510 RepID=A0A927CC55_9BACL|nr:hypothetical protein [Paenibacillus oceani]